MHAAVPKEYEFLIHKELVADENITVENTIKQVWYWISFRVAASHKEVIEDAFDLFNNVIMLMEKYISTMASYFSSPYQTNGRKNCGIRRIKYIIVFTNWVQDFYRVSGLPSIVGLSDVYIQTSTGYGIGDGQNK